MKSTILAAIALAASIPMSGFAQHQGQEFVIAKNIKWGTTPSLPGAKFAVLQGPMNQPAAFIARIQFPDGYKIAPHFHSSIEHVTVISGTFAMGHGEKFDQAKLTPLRAGDVERDPHPAPGSIKRERNAVAPRARTVPIDPLNRRDLDEHAASPPRSAAASDER